MKRGRYTTVDNWRNVFPLHEATRADGTHVVLAIDECDVREISGTIWHDGAQRVRLVEGKIPGFRAKTFIGEVAWADAQRYCDDWITKVRYGRA